MALDLDVRNMMDVQTLVQIVAALSPRTGFAEVPSALARIGGGPFSTQVYPRQPPTPSWLWCDTGNQLIVASAGIMTPSDGLAVFASTLQPLVGLGTARINGACFASAQAMFNAMQPRWLQGPRRWVLAGHSYGGATMLALAAIILSAGAAQDVRVCTFGSPRPGDNGLSAVLTRCTVRRYMNAGDPVPRFPPHVNEAPLLTIAGGYPLALQWSRYTQPNGGVVLTSDGVLSVAQLPPAFLPVTDVQLAGWALSDRGFFATAHSIVSYQIRVALAAAAMLDTRPDVQPGSAPEPANVLTQQEFLDVAAGAAPSPAPTEAFPMSQGYIPTDFRAKAVRTTMGDYVVQWMGQNVLTGHNRSNARALAAKLNLYLRVMQGAKSADHTNFNVALGNYWTVCTEAALGFNPPLTVT